MESMCANFTNMNKACMMDIFLLPHIDQLSDTVGHTLLSFMDVTLGTTR